MRSKPKKNILWITGDISYPGGTEEFTKGLLSFISSNSNSSYNIYLYETCSHGKFINKSIYRHLSKYIVNIFLPASDNYDPFDLRKSQRLQKIIKKNKIDIVHSSLFISDLITFISLSGTKKAKESISKIPSKPHLKEITDFWPLPSKQYEFASIEDIKWVSTKFCNFSIALQEDTPQWKTRKKIYDNELEPIIARECDQIIAVSKEIKEKWSEWNTDIEVIPCASIGAAELKTLKQLKKIRPHTRKKYKIDKFKRIYASASRFEPQKGVDDLIKAFSEHSKTRTSDALLLCGEGSMFQRLKTKYGTNPQIIFFGHLPRNETLEILSVSDVSCLVSHSEGLPLSIQEGMAASNAVLATNVGGIKDLVDVSNGILVEPRNIAQIKSAMDQFSRMDDPEINRLKNASSKRIQKHFLKEEAYKKYIQIYNQIS